MEAVDEDTGILDRFALHFDHGALDLPAEVAFASSRHLRDFGDGDLASALDRSHHSFGGMNLSSNVLDATDNLIYGAPFSSLDAPSENLPENGDGKSRLTSSVVDAVASGAINCSTNDSKVYAGERFDLSNSTSPNDDKKSCTCKDCGKVFNSVWYLKQHAVKHSSERPFKCKFCHKTYRFRSNLYQHKCPLRDRASELATAAMIMGNGKLGNGGPRKVSTSTATDSPHPSSESSSSADIGSIAATTKTRKRRAWPSLTSSPPGGITTLANGHKPKMRKGNFQPNADSGSEAASMLKFDPLKRCAVSTSSIDSPSSPSSMNQGISKQANVPVLSDDDIQKFLDRHKDKLHKCPKCKSLWPSREYLTRHMEWHNDESARFRCVQCSETFVDEHRYGLHKQNHAPSSLHVCGRCRGKFCTRVALKKHAGRCLMVDIKANGFNGSVVQRSTLMANGYRQALFIDQTPPPSPTPAIENGAGIFDEKEATKSGKKDGGSGNIMHLAPVQHTSLFSNDGDSKFDFDGLGNKLFSSVDAMLLNNSLNGRENFENGGVDFGLSVATNPSAITTASDRNGPKEGLVTWNGTFSNVGVDDFGWRSFISALSSGSADCNQSSSRQPLEKANTPYLYNPSVSTTNVPRNCVVSSSEQQLDSSHNYSSPVVHGLKGQDPGYHSDLFDRPATDEADFGVHAARDAGSWAYDQEALFDLQVQHGGPYFYHADSEMRLAESSKSFLVGNSPVRNRVAAESTTIQIPSTTFTSDTPSLDSMVRDSNDRIQDATSIESSSMDFLNGFDGSEKSFASPADSVPSSLAGELGVGQSEQDADPVQRSPPAHAANVGTYPEAIQGSSSGDRESFDVLPTGICTRRIEATNCHCIGCGTNCDGELYRDHQDDERSSPFVSPRVLPVPKKEETQSTVDEPSMSTPKDSDQSGPSACARST